MKKLFALLLCLVLLVPAFALAETEITLWTYPIGSWSKSDVVDEIVANFNAVYPDIKVKVEYLDYTSGDDQVTAAIEAGTTPDIIFEGPERLVANWGAAGKMMDISDLWTEETSAEQEETLTITPRDSPSRGCVSICLTTACVMNMLPLVFVPTTSSKLSSVIWSRSLRSFGAMPALLTSTSILPCASAVSRTTRSRSSVQAMLPACQL